MAASSLPAEVLRTAPGVKGWLNTIGMFAPSMRAAWGGGGASRSAGASAGAGAPAAPVKGSPKGASVSVPVAADKSRAIEANDDGDDVDSLFGDDDEEEGAAGAAGGRAAQMAAVKAEKDKKKKLDRFVLPGSMPGWWWWVMGLICGFVVVGWSRRHGE